LVVGVVGLAEIEANSAYKLLLSWAWLGIRLVVFFTSFVIDESFEVKKAPN
jgi:hypothetical protein